MNKYKGFSKMWFLVLLLVAFAAGCASNGGDPGTLVSIKVSPVSTSIPVTGTIQYTALAIYGDGAARDVTASSTWTSGGPGVTFGAIKGLATGAFANVVPVTITAAYGGKTATAALVVNAATSKGLRLTPALAATPVTGTQKYAAIETFSDGSTFDRTAASIWTAPNLPVGGAAVATISSTGLATGVLVGQATITATFIGVDSITKTATATLTVNAATPVSFTVTPATTSIPITGTRQYTAIQTFSDGTTIDRTAASIWTAPNLPVGGAVVATVSATGLATGVVAGQSTITARYTGVDLVARTATATLTVNAATPVSFTVTPALTAIPITGTRQYTALQTFSDGSTIDRTAASVWTAPNLPAGGPGVATITSSGLATGTASGQATITAKYTGADLVLRTATATLTVNAATSTGFTVTPVTTSIPVTGTRQYAALETFSDGSTIDRTAASTWTAPDLSGGPGVATILPSGLATGVTAGQATITAKYTGADLITKTAIATLTVNAATPVLFTVTPVTTSIPVTGTRQYLALQTFSDGSTIDRTAASIWSAPDLSGGPGVATILPSGLATGAAAGKATITAKYTGVDLVTKTATATLTVSPAASVGFTVTPATTSLTVTGTRQYTALETFSDGSTIDRTAASIWTAPDLIGGPGVATISLTGLATGAVVGQATITAKYTGADLITKTATAVLTVTAAPVPPPPPADLLSTYGIASYGGITNSGATKINGDVVLDPTATCNLVPILFADGPGFGLCGGNILNIPTINAGDKVVTPTYPDTTLANAVMIALTAKWTTYSPAGRPGATVLGCGTIGNAGGAGAGIGCSGNATLPPGTYISATNSTIGVTGDLTLDGGGNANAVWVFQAPSALTTAVNSKIILTGGAKASNIWWYVGSSATILGSTAFNGNILASASISMGTGATSCGRLLAGAAGSGAFTFLNNTVSVPGHPSAPPACQ